MRFGQLLKFNLWGQKEEKKNKIAGPQMDIWKTFLPRICLVMLRAILGNQRWHHSWPSGKEQSHPFCCANNSNASTSFSQGAVPTSQLCQYFYLVPLGKASLFGQIIGNQRWWAPCAGQVGKRRIIAQSSRLVPHSNNFNLSTSFFKIWLFGHIRSCAGWLLTTTGGHLARRTEKNDKEQF